MWRGLMPVEDRELIRALVAGSDHEGGGERRIVSQSFCVTDDQSLFIENEVKGFSQVDLRTYFKFVQVFTPSVFCLELIHFVGQVWF